jgi:serine/threonine protein phosphatase PrpC
VGHVGDSSALLVDMEGGVTRLTENHNTFNESEVERVRASGALVEFSRGCPVPRVWDRPPHLGGRGSMVTRWVGCGVTPPGLQGLGVGPCSHDVDRTW